MSDHIHIIKEVIIASFRISLDSNTNGSYYYSNDNGSTYYNSGRGSATYTAPNGYSHTYTTKK
jgi:ligand-binding sensor domain-containing protein